MNYCIYGTEGFLVRKKIDAIAAEWLKEDGAERITYDAAAKDFSIQRLLQDCWTIPFLSAYKLIVVENAGFLSASGSLGENDQKALLEYFKKSCPETVLILSGNFEKLDQRKKLVKEMNRSVKITACNALDEASFHAEVRAALKKRALKLDNAALNELLSRLKPDLQALENELNKLSLYPGKLDQEAIVKLVARPLEDNVFELVDAVVQRDLARSLHLWRDLQTANTEPVGLVALLGAQFRLLNQVKVLKQQRKSEAEMASFLKVHPYRVKLAAQSVQELAASRLEKLLQKCAALDQALKSGSVERNLGFETFLIACCKEG